MPSAKPSNPRAKESEGGLRGIHGARRLGRAYSRWTDERAQQIGGKKSATAGTRRRQQQQSEGQRSLAPQLKAFFKTLISPPRQYVVRKDNRWQSARIQPIGCAEQTAFPSPASRGPPAAPVENNGDRIRANTRPQRSRRAIISANYARRVHNTGSAASQLHHFHSLLAS